MTTGMKGKVLVPNKLWNLYPQEGEEGSDEVTLSLRLLVAFNLPLDPAKTVGLENFCEYLELVEVIKIDNTKFERDRVVFDYYSCRETGVEWREYSITLDDIKRVRNEPFASLQADVAVGVAIIFESVQDTRAWAAHGAD